jgi:hypothetical protein
MNYALDGNFEDSLVEARRVNHKLELMVTQGLRKYKQNAFARYLSAILYEAEHDPNNAYVDYKNTYDLAPQTPNLGLDLWRCAWQLRMPDEMEKWDQVFHLTAEDHAQARLLGKSYSASNSGNSAKAEVIVLYENGISPMKKPNPVFRSLPKFYSRYNPVSYATVSLNGEIKGNTFILDDIEATAKQNLDEKYGGMIAKKVAGVVAKETVGYTLDRQSPLLGFLARVAMYASDEADLRSWNLLPKDLQMLRVVVDPGTYRVSVVPIGRAALPEKIVQVGPGKKVFVNFRYMP